MAEAVIPPLPAGFTMDAPPLPPGFSVDEPDTMTANRSLAKSVAGAFKQAGQTVADVATVWGPIEAALHVATGFTGAFPAYLGGGVGQIINRVSGLSEDDPKEIATRFAQAMTYQPRTAAGQRLAATVMLPFSTLTEASEKAGHAVAEKTGSPAAGALTEATVATLPPILIGALGRRLAGRTPTREHFRDTAEVLAKDKPEAAPVLEEKLRRTYEKTGVDPTSVYEATRRDPTVIQDLAAENREVVKIASMADKEAAAKLPTPAAAGNTLGADALKALDAEYAKAVAAGDTAQAQRLVLRAAGIEKKASNIERGGAHAPADVESGAPAYDLTDNGIYPKDIYAPEGFRYYSTGNAPLDAEAYSIVSALRNHPNKVVRVYRAIEKDAKVTIQPGDWVTTVKKYAQEHGEGALNGEYKVISKVVKAKDIYTSGDSWLEWGYQPQDVNYPKAIVKNESGQVKSLSERFGQNEQAAGGAPPAQPPSGGGEPPARPERPAGVPEPPEPQRAVLSRISIDEAPKRSYTLDQLYTDAKEDLWPIKKLVEEMRSGPLETGRDPYKLARLVRGVQGKAEQFLEFSPFKFETYENVGRSLKSVLEPVKNDMDGMRAYAVARRAIELNERGITTGVPLEEARATVTAGTRYAAVFDALREYQNHLTDYLKDAGVLSDEAVAAMREANRDYVPFFRLMDEAEFGGAGKGLKTRNPVKAIKGSERLIVDPLESIVKNTYLYTALAERNAVGRALVELARQSGRTDLVKKVSASVRPINVTDAELSRFLDQQGIEGNAEAFTIFRRGNLTPAEDQIVVFENGKRTLYEVPREVAAAFKATDQQSASMLVRMLAKPASWLRAGATLAPEFIARNPIRDQFSAYVLSKSGYVPILDMVRGALSVIKQDAAYQNWIKSGGANAALVSMDRDYVQIELARRSGGLGFADKTWNIVKNPLEPLRIASELMENATRVGEFKKATRGLTTKEAIQSGGFESREVTLDFARIGAKTRSMNLITAFWNANLEGIDRVIRGFNERPMQTTVAIATGITLPSILLWWANHDDPRWHEIPNWERDLFWIVLTPQHIYRIPKPFELGVVFGSSVERILDAYFDAKPEAFKDFTQSMVNTFGLNVIPTVAAPILGQITNWNFFTDRPIVPSRLEGILPAYQYQPYTTELTKALGRTLGMIPKMGETSMASPLVIDNYIRSWSGTLGTYAVELADLALRKTGQLPDPIMPAKDLADMPVIRGFIVRHPSGQAQSIQDFQDRYRKAKTRIDTIKHLAQMGDADSAIREASVDPVALVRLEQIHAGLNTAQRLIQLVYQNQSITPDEKRQLIDTAYSGMLVMARAGMDTIYAIERATKKQVAMQ